MDTQKMFELFKPALLTYIKAKKEEMEKEGFIPTLELLIEELEK